MKLTAKQLAQILGGTIEGDQNAEVTSFGKIEHGRPGQISFFANPKYEQYVYTSKASVLLVNSDFVPKQPVTPTMIKVENAYTAVADLLKYVADQKKRYRRHRSLRSHIAFSAKLGRRVWVGDFVHIGSRCRIGDRTFISDNVTIGENTRIGSDCIIYPGVRIYPGMVIGDRVILHENCVIGSDGFGNAPQPDGTWQKIEHLGNVVIGNDVEIGSCSTVDRAQMESTIIGNGVRIDNLCMIAHNVEVGDNTVMAAQCGIAGSTKVGRNCIFAGQVGIVGHINIADRTTAGGQTGIMGNVKEPGQTLFGSPSLPHRQFLRAYAKFRHSGDE